MIFSKQLAFVGICLLFSSVTVAEDTVMSMKSLEQFYFDTLGDLEDNGKLPFPTLFIYDQQQQKILSKEETLSKFEDKTPLTFIRHKSVEQAFTNQFFLDKSFNIDENKKFIVFYFVVVPWVFTDTKMAEMDNKVTRFCEDNVNCQLIKLFKG